MVLIVGLIVLIVALVVGVAGVLANGGGAHALHSGFSVFGYHVTGSTGDLFLYGILVGVIATFGLSLLVAAARRSSRRGHAARRALQQSRRETADASHDRDQLIDERSPRAGEVGSSAPVPNRHAPVGRPRRELRPFGHRSASR